MKPTLIFILNYFFKIRSTKRCQIPITLLPSPLGFRSTPFLDKKKKKGNDGPPPLEYFLSLSSLTVVAYLVRH